MHTLGTYDLMVLAVGAICFGFYLLIKGGDWAIDGAIYFAEKAGMSKLFVGATILAFGTSIPELFASVNANLSGFPGIALGNVIGSNIANILLVLGATAIIYPVVCKPKEILADVSMMILASIALYFSMQLDIITRSMGIGMFAVLVCFVVYQYRASLQSSTDTAFNMDPQQVEAQEQEAATLGSSRNAILMLLFGFGALAVGSELLVKGAVTIGTAIGVPEAIIGITVVAFGTSLPELATCIIAAAKKHTDMLVGNIIGSNVFNILSIVGITAMIKPISVDPALTGISLWVMAGSAAFIAAWLLAGLTLRRPLGVILVMAYVGFIGIQYV